ncbi:hypothetical protein COW80_02015 [Candidatus Beckwithbacteria bacterium CG22_combo_CG10-13_8_21_14_all_01_47_9]|uniref:Uncharacterized protein n=1 Tax=Candidatus Beckwithbacteria bacterium CG22_combo_CG10-13_8_21_14_all_01_47_9 TaxID=1974496 RepID=A0A2H0E1L6_9BACT|nr:MAG: hypothetical protein COW80_02015 [Candidatus Beckwithbacteria bacterium CG22_combo_CG10-13_8_21_14_all_01_47_9]
MKARAGHVMKAYPISLLTFSFTPDLLAACYKLFWVKCPLINIIQVLRLCAGAITTMDLLFPILIIRLK